MQRMLKLVLLLLVLFASSFGVAPRRAQAAVPGQCTEGTLPLGALSLFCIPSSNWNGDLVVWAHGYTDVTQPLDFQNLTLPGNIYLPNLVQSLGFAFATTSYRANGLVILEGADDIRRLIKNFRQVSGREPVHTYLVGASEGGIITTQVVEQSPELLSGGLSACGPIGSFQAQINYVGDFRVLFDYFFPGVIPGSPISIPPEVIAHWDDTYVPRIKQALAARPGAAWQLIKTSKAPIDPKDLSTVETTAINVLWYNVFGTNDATRKFGGNPYSNTGRFYTGSTNDLLLNARVPRFEADQNTAPRMARYETTGKVTIPMVILHTTGDEIIPFWHERLYRAKIQTSGQGQVTQIPIVRYGHCNFKVGELLASFGLLVRQVTGHEPDSIAQRPDVADARRQFPQLRPARAR